MVEYYCLWNQYYESLFKFWNILTGSCVQWIQKICLTMRMWNYWLFFLALNPQNVPSLASLPWGWPSVVIPIKSALQWATYSSVRKVLLSFIKGPSIIKYWGLFSGWILMGIQMFIPLSLHCPVWIFLRMSSRILSSPTISFVFITPNILFQKFMFQDMCFSRLFFHLQPIFLAWNSKMMF